MKKNIWIGVLLIAVVMLAALVGFQSQQIAALKEQMRAMVEVERAVAKSARAPAPAPVEEVPAPVAEVKPVESVAEATPVASVATAGGTTNNPMAGLAQMMKNPQMKEMIRGQQKFALEGMYGSLPKYLNLSTNEMDSLKELLLDRQMALVDAGMSMMNGTGTDQKQAAEDAKTLKAEYDKKISDLHGPQDYPVFQDYEKSAADRMSVQMFKGSLPADSTLTDQQEESLVAAMAEERKALPPSSMVNNQSPDPSKFTEEGIAEALKQMEQLQQRDAERAATILTPAQLDQFTKFQQQMNSMAAAGMKMAVQMFGNKNAAPAPAAGTGP